ncbi:MAG: protein kinase [Cyanobacteria bacterium J06560_2]
MAYCPNSVCPQPKNDAAAKFCQACGTPLILEDKYGLFSLLGKGGFGRTLLAQSVESAGSISSTRQCVVKQLHNKALLETSAFKGEIDRLRRLGEHPQIPRLLDAFENDLGQFLVQELAPGENLQQQVTDQGPWNEADVRSLLKSLIAVLQYVHSFQIIHRDIKPENIVAPIGRKAEGRKADSRRSAPMLVDFGSAKWVRQTPAQTVIGSAGYASPEQSMGQATFASDIYSLGLTCLYLLTGVHPFQLYSAAEDRWVWKDYLTEPIEPRFAQVLDQMVERSLQQRYESADHVALDLQFSQNLLLSASQQVLSQAKASVPGLKSLLKPAGEVVLETLKLGEKWVSASTGGSSKSIGGARGRIAGGATGREIGPTSMQSWQRRCRLGKDIGLTQVLAISADAQHFASGGSDGSVRLWHLSSAELLHTFSRRRLMGTGHGGAVTALVFHPDNRVLYSASEDGTIKEWDIAERQLLNTLPVAGWTPTDLAVTADGAQLISANRDGKIIIWDIESLLVSGQLAQHQQGVSAIALAGRWTYSGDFLGDLLASASDDGTVKLWRQTRDADHSFQLAKTLNLRRDRSAKTIANKTQKDSKDIWQDLRVVSVALCAVTQNTYQLVCATSAREILLYTLDEHLDVTAPIWLHQFSQPIKSLAMGADDCLAVATEDRVLTLWQLNTLSCVAELAHDWGLKATASSADGRLLITASEDETISLWQRTA